MASDLQGFTKQEVLNKVLNTSNDSLQVDIVDATGVTITTSDESVYTDDADWTNDTSKHTLVGGLFGSNTITSGDTGPISLATDGAVHINDGGKTITVDGTVTVSGLLSDGHNVTIDNIASNEVYVRGSGTAGTADAGVVTVQGIASGTAQPVSGTVTANAGSGTLAVSLAALPASTDTIEVVGDAVEDAAAAGNPVLTGGRYDDPTTDNSGARSLDDNDVGALALDPTGALYVREHLGSTGSCYVTGTPGAVTAAVGKFVAIQFLEDTVFNTSNGLVATDANRWPDDSAKASDIGGSNTVAVAGQVFPQGMTIFGRWDSFILASGSVIAYVGNV